MNFKNMVQKKDSLSSLSLEVRLRKNVFFTSAKIFSKYNFSMLAIYVLNKILEKPKIKNPLFHEAFHLTARIINNKKINPKLITVLPPISASALVNLQKNQNLLQTDIRNRNHQANSHPESVTFLMIEQCNSRCLMCGDDYNSGKSKRMMNLAKYEKIAGNFDMSKVSHITFGGGGEPLLNEDLREIVEYSNKNFPHVRLEIITNGISLNEDIARFLIKNQVDFKISINASTPETYYQLFQVDKFNEVIKNISRLNKIRKEEQTNPNIFLSFVSTKINIHELPEVVRIAHKYQLDGLLVFYLRLYPLEKRTKKNIIPENKLTSEQCLVNWQEISDKYVFESLELAKSFNISFNCEPLFDDFDFKKTSFYEKPCEYAWKTIYIGYDGEVYTCPGSEILFKNKIESGHYSSGNILKNPINEIWNNVFHIKLRETVSGSSNNIPECTVCGNQIMWLGPFDPKSHILDWSIINN